MVAHRETKAVKKDVNVKKGTKGFVSREPKGKINVPQAAYSVNWFKAPKRVASKAVDRTVVLTEEELNTLPVPAAIFETRNYANAVSIKKGKLLPGSPIAAKDIDRDLRDIIIAQYADLRDKKIADIKSEFEKVFKVYPYSWRVDKMKEDCKEANKIFLAEIEKVKRDYPRFRFSFKRSTVCQSCGKRDSNWEKDYCRQCLINSAKGLSSSFLGD